MKINDYFDKIYVLNLHKRKDRLLDIDNRLKRFGIQYERFGATDGSVMRKVWEKFLVDNDYFTTPNYLACSISHLSIYRDAVEKNYQRILIIEDDVLVNRNIHLLFESVNIPDWSDLFYIGYIPLSEDQSMWTYGMINEWFSDRIFRPKNLWGLFAYGLTNELMKEILEIYDSEFPMEIDRFLVTKIQPRGNSIAMSPQLFACQDIYSDNMNMVQLDMLRRSVDSRFANNEDYE
jgi:GR25 family glycosyltransferase involved in LPS biosynthesis